MSHPVNQVLCYGRAFAEVLKEKIEANLTDTLSELNKFSAEQQEQLRQFTEEVKKRAEMAQQDGGSQTTTAAASGNNWSSDSTDLQETLDELRAEIARLRTELQKYKQDQP